MMMSFVSDRPPPMPDPRDLTPSQIKALQLIRDYKLRRVKGGWQAPGTPKVTLPTAQFLGFKRLVDRRFYETGERIEPTALGRQVLAIAEERRRK